MAVATDTPAESLGTRKNSRSSTFVRVSRFFIVRLLTLFATVVVGVYLTIMIANMGGYVDQIMRGQIRDTVTQKIGLNPATQKMDPEVRRKLIEDSIALEEKRLGLDVPIAIRNFRYLSNALTLRLGRAINMTSDSGSKQVRLVLLERLPATLLLMGTSQLFLFFSSVFLALSLSRRYGDFWDKVVIALSPTSAVPPWFYGIFSDIDFCGSIESAPVWRDGGLSPAGKHIRVWSQSIETLDFAGYISGDQFILPKHLQLQDIFPDLFQ